MPQLTQGLGLDLADTLTGDVELLAYLFQRAGTAVLDTEAQLQHLLLPGRQGTQHIHQLLLQQGKAGGLAGLGRGLVGDEVAQMAVLLLADALVTDVPGIPLIVFSADCNVLLLHDPVRRVIGAAHAGWRGTAAGIAAETVRVMAEDYGCDPADLRAAIGPAIGPCCFETDGDVPEALRAALGAAAEPFMAWNGSKWHIDLKAVNALWLQKAGVTHIDICDHCTACRPDLYWSHRKMGLRRGEQAALIALREDTL